MSRQGHLALKTLLPCSMVFVVLLLPACNLPGIGAPDKVVQLGNEHINAMATRDGAHIKDLRVLSSKSLTLTPADRANGIDGAWCVQFGYISDKIVLGRWVDGNVTLTIRSENGSPRVTGLGGMSCSGYS